MSDTPRIDAEMEHAGNISLWICTGKHGMTEEENALVVPVDFARTLERELNQANREVEQLRSQLEEAKSALQFYSDNIRADSKGRLQMSHPIIDDCGQRARAITNTPPMVGIQLLVLAADREAARARADRFAAIVAKTGMQPDYLPEWIDKLEAERDALKSQRERELNTLTAENHELTRQLAEANARYHRDVEMYPDSRIEELTLQLSSSDHQLVIERSKNRKALDEIYRLQAELQNPQHPTP